jgi:GNAT superfamily N-acetyltransferase
MNEVIVEPLSVERMNNYLRFFDTKAFIDNPRWAGCYCYFPLHDPRQTNWQQRTGSENRAAVCGCIEAGRAQGFLAYRGADVVGWCSAGPRSLYPMLEDEPGPEPQSMGIVFCFVVAPEFRGEGIAATLLAAACEGLRAQGLTVVQGRPAREASGPAANHLGPLSMYLSAGFRIVREDSDGNVYVQKDLVR